jgi:hypothetical protein
MYAGTLSWTYAGQGLLQAGLHSWLQSNTLTTIHGHLDPHYRLPYAQSLSLPPFTRQPLIPFRFLLLLALRRSLHNDLFGTGSRFVAWGPGSCRRLPIWLDWRRRRWSGLLARNRRGCRERSFHLLALVRSLHTVPRPQENCTAKQTPSTKLAYTHSKDVGTCNVPGPPLQALPVQRRSF